MSPFAQVYAALTSSLPTHTITLIVLNEVSRIFVGMVGLLLTDLPNWVASMSFLRTPPASEPLPVLSYRLRPSDGKVKLEHKR